MSDPVDPTPPMEEAMQKVHEVAAIEISVKKKDAERVSVGGSGLALPAKFAHLLAVIVSGVIALFVSAVLADGRSVVRLKDVVDLPRLTDEKWKKRGLDYRADELLGPRYGVGLHHDASGYTWTQCGAKSTLQTYINELGIDQTIAAVPAVIAIDGLKHPVRFLDCEELQKAGLSAMSLGFIAEVVAAVMIIFHGLMLLGLLTGKMSAKLAKVFAALIWLTLTAGFLLVICLALGIMETTWKCNNDFIPEVKLSDHFVFQYGLVFGYLGYISALLVFCVILVFTSTKDGVTAQAYNLKGGLVKVVGGVVVGLIMLVVFSTAVAGSKDAFSDDGPLYDPETNYCEGQKPKSAGPGDNYFKNTACFKDGVAAVLEQAGANVTKGFKGGMDAGTWRVPITSRYENTDLCPVNVHWHLGAEHLSLGQFDEKGKGPNDGGDDHKYDEYSRRKLAGSNERLGFRCHHYDENDKKFTEEYDWKYCKDMKVGETYEIHWPHSAAGACGTKWQYQTPFYDGVFCRDGVINHLTPLNTYENIGVQAQIFTVVNDDDYYYGDLFKGMIVSEKGEGESVGKVPKRDFGTDMAMYTGSTTGTSRDNALCSRYAPITWQVDRTCHLISASSFDHLCKVMKQNADDMEGDTHPHGAREVVWQNLTANNQWDLP